MALIKKEVRDLYQRIVETAGVYVFLNESHEPIYIGKAINLRNRIKQHFTNDEENKEQLIEKNSVYIKLYETNSEFEALVLEANMIRKFQPKYNAALRDDKSRLYIVITKEEFPKVRLERKLGLEEGDWRFVFGPLNSALTGRQLLKKVRQIVPFCTEKKLGTKPCFYSQIGYCHPCPNEIDKLEGRARLEARLRYRKSIGKVIKLLKGNGQLLLKELKKELLELSNSLAYEEAILVRNRIFYLEKLFQKKLIFDERLEDANFISALRSRQSEGLRVALSLPTLERVECYDISNLNFKEATASMVVFKNGVAQIDDYRRFRIKGQRRFDPEMLLEVLIRRLKHSEWPKPDLIVIDGGTPQLMQTLPVLEGTYRDLPLIVGFAKRPDRLVFKDPKETLPLAPDSEVLHYLQRIRDEAHRFAKKYHLLLRRKTLDKIKEELQ